MADEAKVHGHSRIQLAVMQAPTGEIGLLLFCGLCGAFNQRGREANSTRLIEACRPSPSGKYALNRLLRGLHPRATAEWRGYKATDIVPMQWQDADGDERSAEAYE